MKFVFFGTDDFSVAILEKLMSDFYYPSLVISQPDKPVGRKQVMTPPPIKHVCETHRIPLLQPTKAIETLEAVRAIEPDLFIVASFGQLLPKALLAIPKQGAVNVHTSLLPAYRGASPIQAAIIDGQSHTGITIMVMDEQLGHGPIIHQERLAISPTETNGSLRARLATFGADTLCKILPDFLNGKIQVREQKHDVATFTTLITKEQAKVDWKQNAATIERQVRAYTDWPVAWTVLPNQKRLKIIEAGIANTDQVAIPGTLAINAQGLRIAAQDGWLEVLRLQVEGKEETDAKQFSTGYKNLDGQQCLI